MYADLSLSLFPLSPPRIHVRLRCERSGKNACEIDRPRRTARRHRIVTRAVIRPENSNERNLVDSRRFSITCYRRRTSIRAPTESRGKSLSLTRPVVSSLPAEDVVMFLVISSLERHSNTQFIHACFSLHFYLSLSLEVTRFSLGTLSSGGALLRLARPGTDAPSAL